MGQSQRIVLLGANGRLGAELARSLAARSEVTVQAFDRAHVNLADPGLIEQVLERATFDVLINTAAHTAVDDAESQGSHAYQINGYAVGQIARLCAEKGAKMIHFSTDYVFDGSRAAPYTEDDAPNPASVYGKSKLLGEHQTLAASPGHLVFRLAWLFGPARPAFPEWVLRQAAAGRVRVVADKTGCPTYSVDVVKWLEPFLFGAQRDTGGIFHLCNPPACSWLDWAREVLRLAGSPIAPEAITLAELPGLQAPRPTHSALSVEKFERLTGLTCRPWQDALAEYMAGRRGVPQS